MRNLSLLSRYSTKYVSDGSGGPITFDLDSKSIILANEVEEPEACVRIFRVASGENENEDVSVC